MDYQGVKGLYHFLACTECNLIECFYWYLIIIQKAIHVTQCVNPRCQKYHTILATITTFFSISDATPATLATSNLCGAGDQCVQVRNVRESESYLT